MKITIVLDNPNSWFVPYADKLTIDLKKRGHTVLRVGDPEKIKAGDCTFLLSCEKIISKEILKRNTHNIVIHASALPKGKGWSPLTWQILEGKDEIPTTLFEAVERVDAGDSYFTETVKFAGHELIDELRAKEGDVINALALRFVDAYPNVKGIPQKGEETFYPRRRPKDSEIDVGKSIKNVFNQLRVADNERYPAFFNHKGHTYILKIYKKDTQ